MVRIISLEAREVLHIANPLTVFRVCGVDTVAFILVNLAEHGQEAIDTTDQLIQ